MPKNITFDRELVIKKVTNLFWEKGFNGTSMQDLVDATGLNRSSFYNTFGDKSALFEESLKYYQGLQNELTGKYLNDPSKSPKQSLIALFEGICQQILSDEENKGCFLSNCTAELGASDQGVNQFLSENMNAMVSLFQTIIEKAQAKGEIDADKNSKHLALFLFSSLQGIRITSMIDRNGLDTKGITDQIISTL